MKHCHRFPSWSLTCSCCWRARSICCRCFSICEAASFFCSSWAARSCSRKLISWVIIVESCRSFSARLSGVPKCAGKIYCKYEMDNSYQAIFKKKKKLKNGWITNMLISSGSLNIYFTNKSQKNLAHSFAVLQAVEDITKIGAEKIESISFFLTGVINDALCTNPYIFSI